MPTKYKSGRFYRVPLDNLEIKPGFNPRSELGDLSDLKSQIVASCGVLVNLLVWQERDDNGEMHNYISSGHRRFAAMSELIAEGADVPNTVPVQFESKKLSEAELFCNAILTNTGEPLTIVDAAAAVTRLTKMGYKQKEIVAKFGRAFGRGNNECSIATVSNLKTLDNGATPEVKAALKSGEINQSTAMEIIKKTKTVDGQKAALESEKSKTLAEKSNGKKKSNRRTQSKPANINNAIKQSVKDDTKPKKTPEKPNDGRLRDYDLIARQLEMAKENPARIEKNWIDGFKTALEFAMKFGDGLNESGHTDSGKTVAKFII